jgi:hypothetical protein
MHYIKIISINLLILSLLSSCLEIGARLSFPEFQNHIFTKNKSMNVSYHDGDFHGYQIRKPSPNNHEIESLPLILVIGDSISGGFGTAYEDIWWEKLERILKSSGINVEIVSISAYGNNIADAVQAVNKIAKVKSLEIKKIIYQFNYNDIMPFQKNDLQNSGSTALVAKDLFYKIARWRYEYANHSVFLRASQHYAGKLMRRTSGTCMERDLHALGPYTWSFGSQARIEESKIFWEYFKKNIIEMNNAAKNINSDFEILISPILYDIDHHGVHLHYNYLNYDFKCATIDPKNKMLSISNSENIKVYDPAQEMKRSFEARVNEGNFEPYFFTADDNHFTPLAGSYVAEVILAQWENRTDKE